MEDNCFTMLCWFLPYIHMSQSQVCMLPLPLEPPCQLPSHPTPLGCHRLLGLSSLPHTANPHWLSVWHMVIVNVNVHTFVNVHMFWCYSLSLSHPFLPLLCLQVCSLCLCLHWKWKCKSLSCVWLSATPWTGLPGSSVHGILQARTLEWVAFPFSRGSSQPRDQTQVFHIAGGFFTSWVTRGAKNTGVGNLSLLQQIFLTQELNQSRLHCRRIFYQLRYQGSLVLKKHFMILCYFC